jgi:hypothetical protein
MEDLLDGGTFKRTQAGPYVNIVTLDAQVWGDALDWT